MRNSLLLNSVFIFLSMGLASVKAIIDSYWLGQVDGDSMLAFGFAFPILVLSNSLVISLGNMVLGSFSCARWIDSGFIEAKVFACVSLAALLFGAVIAMALDFCGFWLIEILGAGQFHQPMQTFLSALIYWLPFSLLTAVWVTCCRGLGLFKLSAVIVILANLASIGCCYYLLFVSSDLAPMQALVLSNALGAILSILGIGVLLKYKVTFAGELALETFFTQASKKMLAVFNSSIVANLFAVAFIFALTKLLAQHGSDVVSAMVYLTRIEQLIITLYVAVASVILPQISHLLRQQDDSGIAKQISAGSKTLALLGLLVTLVTYGIIYSLSAANPQSSTLQTLDFMAMFWLISMALQGVSIFYLQLLSIFLAPRLALKFNLVRFMLAATPALFAMDHYFGVNGILALLVIFQLLSLIALYFLLRQDDVVN